MVNKNNKRSLKKRINRTMSLLNFSSLLIMLVALMLALGLILSLFGNVISKNVAHTMGIELENQWSKGISEGKMSKKITKLTPTYIEMFQKLGPVYKFINGNRNDLNIKKLSMDNLNGKKILSLRKPGIINIPELTAVEYTVSQNNKKIFDSSSPGDKNQTLKTPTKDNWIMKKLNTTTSVSVKNKDGKELAKLEVKLNPIIIVGGYTGLLIICIIIFLLTLFFSRIAIRMLSSVIVKPLEELDKKMNQLATGDIESAMNTEIYFKKPIKEVENLVNSTNKIMSRMNEYIGAFTNQRVELEAQNVSLLENSNALENINLVLANKNSKLKNILDNVEQGFLTFKKDLYIHGEYSLICERFFSSDISRKKLSTVLFSENLTMQKFMDELLIKIFDSDISDRKLFIPLLPEEISINNNVINISYKVVKDEKNEDSMMVIITDITEKRLLEKQMDEERKILKMVVKSIINRDELLELIKEYESFSNVSFKNKTENDFDTILRQIHTFKGNFSQYDMLNLVPRLNELEDKIYDKKSKYNIKDIDTIKLKQWLKDDLSIILSYAGKDFLNEGEYCYIKKDKLIEIEKKIQQTLSQQECKLILPLIKSLTYKSVKDLIKVYADYVIRLSERLGKSIKPIEITGDEVMVDTNSYSNVIKSLSHIFRNCVDHGIETEDERLENGKDEIGNITCQIKEMEEAFQIIISDDGRGINEIALEDKAIINGLYTRNELNKMTAKQKKDLVFMQGITTRSEATYISGRGVGMAAVKQCVNEIGGTITLESVMGKGTTFILTLPKLENWDKNVVTAEQFIEEVARTSKEIIFKQTGLDFNINNIEVNNSIVLDNVTALLSLSGTLNAIIMVSVNQLMARKLVYNFILDNVEEDEIANYIEDVLGEFSNTILGNAFGKFENTKSFFHIGLPAVLSNSNAYIKYTESQIISSKLDCGEFEISINMLLVEDVININELEE